MPSYTVYPATQAWTGSGLNGSSYGTNPAGSTFQNLNPSNVSSDNQSCSFSVPKSSSDQYLAIVPSAACAVTATPQQTTPTNKGYRSNVCVQSTVQPDGKLTGQKYPVTLTAVSVNVGVSLTSLTGCSCWAYARLYGVSASTGSIRFLGQGVSAVVTLSSGMNVLNAGLSGTYSLNADEILQVELALGFNNNAFLAGTVTGWVGINKTSAVMYSAAAQVPQAIVGTAPASGALARSLTFKRPEPEALITADSAKRAFAGSRAMPQTVPTVSSMNRIQALGRGVSDAMSGSSNMDRKLALGRNAPEGAAAASLLSDSFKGTRGLSESVVTLDSVDRSQVLNRSVGTSTETVDVLVRRISVLRPEPEELVTADEISRQVDVLRDASDELPTVDALNRQLNQVRSVLDGPSDFPVTYPTRHIQGTVYESPGVPYLGGAVVMLKRDSDNLVVQSQLSSTADGSYGFVRDRLDPNTYSVIAYADQDTDPKEAVSPEGLVPV